MYSIGCQLITARAVPAQQEAQPPASNNVTIVQAFFLNTGFAMVRRCFSEASCNVLEVDCCAAAMHNLLQQRICFRLPYRCSTAAL